jgi:glycosyltransferase involved in cell wall biosynthesis
MTEKFRLAVVISHPTQHHAPFFRKLSETPGLQLRVFHCCDWGVERYLDPGFGVELAWDVDLLSGYESEVLPIARRPRKLGFLDVDNPAVGSRLSAFMPHAVWLHGYGQRTIWRAAWWARGRAGLIHFGDSELLHERSALKELVRRPVLRWHFGRVDAFVTIGDNNEAYYRAYGVPDKRMFRGAYPVDVSRFVKALDEVDRPPRGAVLARFGLEPEGVVTAMLGKLEARKRPLDLVEAVAVARRRGARVAALLIGDGPLRQAVLERAAALGVSGAVRVTGFVNQKELPWVLGAADVLVTASDFDPHPLAVTEGMAVGLVVVASDRVGCVGPTDAARPGRNALVFRCGDVADLASKLSLLEGDPSLLARMAAESTELAWTQDLRATVRGTLAAIIGMRAGFRERWGSVPDDVFQVLSEHSRA